HPPPSGGCFRLCRLVAISTLQSESPPLQAVATPPRMPTRPAGSSVLCSCFGVLSPPSSVLSISTNIDHEHNEKPRRHRLRVELTCEAMRVQLHKRGRAAISVALLSFFFLFPRFRALSETPRIQEWIWCTNWPSPIHYPPVPVR